MRKASENKEITRTLQNVFGIEKLRPGQREVIEHVLRGDDVLSIMPTGAGKSLCYQLPSLRLEGMTLVVSPLISLMKDQTDKLQDLGLDAENLNSAVSESDQRLALERVELERSDFIFTTPERLTDKEFLETLRGKHINFVVIDEAHCISNWGHDFRPAFLEIREAMHELGDPPVLALTATATPEVIQDIGRQLDRPNIRVINTGIYRPNLVFEVLHTTKNGEKRAALTDILRDTKGSKIVYCATVKAVAEVTAELSTAGIEAESYHGKLSAKHRTVVQDRFMSGETETIVATNAFGMGVDKPDIRAVVHWQMPGSLEAYYQEAGRAGRDGEIARCVLLYDTRDRRVQQFFLGGRYPSSDEVLSLYRGLIKLRDKGTVRPSLDEIKTADEAPAVGKLRVILNLLKEEKIVIGRRGARVELLQANLSDERITEVAEIYLQRGMTDQEKLERMMFYAQSALCRWQTLVSYFKSDEELEKCGTCDNCVQPLAERLEIETPERRHTKAEEEKVLSRIRRTAAQRKVAPGDIVKIPKFGEAEVEDVSGDKIDVVLPGGEKKTFKSEFVSKTR